MSIEILQPASQSPSIGEDDSREITPRSLDEVEQGGEAMVGSAPGT